MFKYYILIYYHYSTNKKIASFIKTNSKETYHKYLDENKIKNILSSSLQMLYAFYNEKEDILFEITEEIYNADEEKESRTYFKVNNIKILNIDD